MYLSESIVDDVAKSEWQSPVHRNVAMQICLGRSECSMMDVLIENIRIVKSLSDDECRKVTFAQLRERGCVF